MYILHLALKNQIAIKIALQFYNEISFKRNAFFSVMLKYFDATDEKNSPSSYTQ